MAEPLNIVAMPKGSLADIAGGLRRVADAIERGDHGDAHNLVWVIDEGGGDLSLGLLGHAGEMAPLAYFLLGLAQRKLQDAALEVCPHA